MAEPTKTQLVTMQELLVSSLAQTDALAKLLIEKGLITRDEFMQKISEDDVSEIIESDAAMTIRTRAGKAVYVSHRSALIKGNQQT